MGNEWEPAQGVCSELRGDLKEREVWKEGIYAYVWLIHFAVQQNNNTTLLSNSMQIKFF